MINIKKIIRNCMLFAFVLALAVPVNAEEPVKTATEQYKENRLNQALYNELYESGLNPSQIRRAFIQYSKGNTIPLANLIKESDRIRAQEDKKMEKFLQEQAVRLEKNRAQAEIEFADTYFTLEKNVDAQAPVASEGRKAGTAVLVPSKFDFVGSKFAPDGQKDFHIRAKCEGTIHRVRVDMLGDVYRFESDGNEGGLPLAVFYQNKSLNLQKNLGNIPFSVKADTNGIFDIFLQTDTKMKINDVKWRITFFLEDGKRAYCVLNS